MTAAPPPTILIVDSDPALLRDHFPCRVSLAASGSELADRLASLGASPALVILDWSWPTGPARELLQQVRDHTALQTVPILVLSAAVNQGRLHQQALAAGAAAFLSKAVDEVELLARIQRLCQAGAPRLAAPRDCPLRLLGRQVARTDDPATVDLTQPQAELFGLLLRDPRPIVPHAELASRVLAYPTTADRIDSLRKRIHRLNQRLAPLDVCVRAQRGVGYRLVWHGYGPAPAAVASRGALGRTGAPCDG
jgi:DNA-binding response OmpR family regulator